MAYFHLQLTGTVGGAQFNAATARKTLAQYPGKHVDILIDSFGGALNEGLSVSGALRDHGDVTAHMRGMCASAATIAAMGANRIEMAPDAFFLVHKVSLGFFDWAERNADELETFIEQLKKCKDDLDALDAGVAAIYARRCKKTCKEMIELMSQEKWLTAEQAKEWGFVDSIDESEEKTAPAITKQLAAQFRALGTPLPPVPVVDDNTDTLADKIINAIKTLFKMDQTTENVQPQEPQAPQQPDNSAEIQDLKNQVMNLQAELEKLKAAKPVETTAVIDQATPAPEEKPVEETQGFFNVNKNAKQLFNSLP